jgi:hypothetical protein
VSKRFERPSAVPSADPNGDLIVVSSEDDEVEEAHRLCCDCKTVKMTLSALLFITAGPITKLCAGGGGG